MARGLEDILESDGGRGSGGSYLLQGQNVGKGPITDASGQPVETQLVARVQGEVGDATSWIVTLDTIRTPTVAYDRVNFVGAGTFNQVLAGIAWGQGGAKFETQIDWRPCSFMVHGAWCEVVCSTSRPSLDILFRASIVPATAARFASVGVPTRTISGGLVGAGGTVELVIPDRARAFHVFASAGITFTASQFTDFVAPTAGPVIVSNNAALGSTVAVTEWMPIHWAMRRLQVQNNGAVGVTLFVEFLMDLG